MTTGFFPSHRLWAAFWFLRSAVLCLLRLGSRQCWVPRLAPVPWILEGEEMFPLNIYRPSTLRNFLLQSQSWGKDGVTPTLHPHRTCLAALFVLGKKVISDRKLKLYIRSEREKKNIRTLKNKLNRGDVQRKLPKENKFHLENSTGNRTPEWRERGKGKISILTIIVQHVSVHFRSAQERHVVATGREEQGQSYLLLLTYGWAFDSGRMAILPL